ncbi:uncharacterized protein LOC119951435 isoform X3 [Scyliorhinus canicula]|uniref:uncharacterized protein LOC119951435 isoform X3 n=1 Tax=Scyliorhinus canicula TaxID=7830 RepID=UPI0018F52BF9|nr:uncharacterized protein LOC119951435 isoform X3 [Scyliorhinus canicula]
MEILAMNGHFVLRIEIGSPPLESRFHPGVSGSPAGRRTFQEEVVSPNGNSSFITLESSAVPDLTRERFATSTVKPSITSGSNRVAQFIVT